VRLSALLAAVVLLLVGCGGDGDDEEWGGYTGEEARDIYLSEDLRQQLDDLQLDPDQYQPTADDLEESPLIKTYFEGREVWRYRDPEKGRCIYVRKDPVVGDFVYQIESC
jgi:hypothetical protein